MLAAIYARKSTDQNLADEEKSVTRQVERRPGICGGEGLDRRPGARLRRRRDVRRRLRDPARVSGAHERAPPASPFQALILMDQSRLGRSLDEVPYALKRITEAGVRVWCYLTDSELRRETATDKFMLSAMAYVDDMHREQARQRTRDAMRRKAERGHVAGGIVYGYRNVEVRIGDRRSHVLREIHPDEAAIIRRIFQMIAEGRGYARIAKVLNAEGIPSPTGRGWATSGVRACVLRELYRGRIVYGKTQWQDRGGERVKVDTPPETWITVEAPALRIVDEALWEAAHRRLDTTRARYARLTAGKRVGRPEPTLESPYLLTGFVRCAGCGGGVSAQVVTTKKGTTRSYYVCTTFRVRGPALCARGFRARLRDLDAAILDRLGRDVLTEDVLMDAARSAAERHAAQQQQHPRGPGQAPGHRPGRADGGRAEEGQQTSRWSRR